MNLFDIAFQLLKEERRWITPLPSEANPNPEPMTTEEYEAHEEQRKEEMRARAAAGEWQLRDADGNLHPDYVDCPTCNGQGFRDEYSGDPEHGGETCYHCYGQGVVHRTEEENRPIDDLMRDMVNDPTKENQEAVRDYFVPQPDMEYDDDFQEKLAGEPMDTAWRLLKSHLDLLSADELFELAAIGTHDPDTVAHFLGEKRLLTSEEAEEITWRAMEAHDAEGESSHPEGISHRENVKQYEEESGRNAHNWGYNVPEMQFGDKEVGAKPMIGPDRPSSLVGRRNYESPQIIGNMPWPQNFTTENKAEPMDMAWRLLKEEDWERYGFERPPWSALNPAPINTYDEEIEALGNAGDTAQARRFISVKNALAQPDAIRQSAIERFGIPISQAIAPEWDDDEHMASAVEFYNRGRNTSDFEDIKNYSPEQQAIMRASMKKLLAQKKRVGQYQERAEELENQLRIDDPTKFFADKRRPFRDPSSQPKPRNRFFNEPNVRPGDTVI